MKLLATCCGYLLVLALMLASVPVQVFAENHPPQEAANRLFYIGLALYSEAWSENDVVELAEKLRDHSHYRVVPMIASNLRSAQHHYPMANDATIATMVRTAAEQAGPDDIVFVNISTHGAPGFLARREGNEEPTPLTARELARKLAPLAGHQTVVVISACYSGSLINDLRTPNWIIVTAARGDRSSFGCGAGSRHTLFGQAELRAFSQPDQSLRQVFTAIRADVARMEREQRFLPSEPQIYVGPQARNLCDMLLF